MSKNAVFLRFAADTFYLSGTASGSYTGSGSPWQFESTTPFELALNDTTGPSYVPHPPEPIPYMSGAPPFSLRPQIVDTGYGAVTESFGIQIRGSTKDNAIAMLIKLRQIVSGALSGMEVILGVVAGGGTTHWRIESGNVTEGDQYIYESRSDSATMMIRATVTWTRSPFGGRLTTPETLINGATMNNIGTGGSDNVEAFSTGTGEMIWEGSPCNYTVRVDAAGASGDPILYAILASIATRLYITPSSPSWSTSGTTFAAGGSVSLGTSTQNIITMLGNPRLKLRILTIVASGHTGNPEFRYELRIGGVTGTAIYSDIIPAVNGDGLTTTRFIDSGPIPISVQALAGLASMAVSSRLNIRSTDGGATTGTVTSSEILIYYDYCTVYNTNVVFGDGPPHLSLSVSSFAEQSGYANIPLPFPQAFLYNTSSTLEQAFCEIRGTVPRYYSGSSLYMRLIDGTASIVYTDTARSAIVTATHAPLWRTLRGAV